MPSDELQEIRRVFRGLQTLYQLHLPKINPALIDDLLIREQEEIEKHNNSPTSSPPFYMVEISTTKSADPEKMKNLIFKKTGLLPSVYENGTHYVANMRLTLELLKVISESEEGIVKVSGDYTGGIAGR
ncbi:MAG: hypothetical protein ACRD5E_05110 [Nitrososphaeraceae archaeon]|jgi:hypothetical protein